MNWVLERVFNYCDDILSGEIKASIKHKWAVQRFKSAEGGIITNSNDSPNAIAIGFESGSKLVWFYKAKLKPGEESNATRKKGETNYKTYPSLFDDNPLFRKSFK